MDTNIIITLVVGFLVLITFARRQMLKEAPKLSERRAENRRHDIRRAHTGRRMNEFHADCAIKNRRKNEDRRGGLRDRRHKQRRHHTQEVQA